MVLGKIRISGIVQDSIVDGPGLRYVIFTQGCKKKCYMCHNPHTQNLKGGKLKKINDIINEIKNNPLITGVTFSGGEPFLQAKSCNKIALFCKKNNINTLSYSGYYYHELLHMNKKNINLFLSNLDYLIDGPFINEKKDISLLFRGSSNQRIIDLNKTKENNIVFINKF